MGNEGDILNESAKNEIRSIKNWLFKRKRMNKIEYDIVDEMLRNTRKEGDGLYLKHEGKTYGQLSKSPWIRKQVPLLGLLL